MDSLKDKTVASFFWRLLERGGNQAVALLVQIVMARLLTSDDFGILAILLVVVNIGNILVQSGLNTALIQAEDVNEDDFSTVLWVYMLFAAIIYALVFLGAPYLASFYDSEIITPTLRVIALILPISAFNAIQSAFLQRNLDFKKIFKATIAATFASGFAGITAALLGLGLWSLVLQQLIYNVINCISLRIQIPWKPRRVLNLHRAKQFIQYGWKIFVPTLLETGYDSLSDLIVGKQFGTSQLGYLSQGKKYPVALDSMIGGTVQPVMFTAVSRTQSEITAVKAIMQRTLKTSFFFVAPIMTTFALTAEPIILVLLGGQWLPAVPFMQMYCLTSALSSFHAINYQTFNGVGRSDLFLKTKLVTISYNVIFLLIAAFLIRNIYAVVIAYMIASVISTFVNSFPNRKLIGYSYLQQLKDILPFVFLAFLCAMIAFPIDALNLPALATAALQWIVSIGAYLVIARIAKLEELSFLVTTIREMLSK